jgi:Ca2+-binding RTX toxin-like protein
LHYTYADVLNKTYKNLVEIKWQSQSDVKTLEILGNDVSYNNNTKNIDGTINAIFEFVKIPSSTGSSWDDWTYSYSCENIGVLGTKFYETFKTKSNTDDISIISSFLNNSDVIKGSTGDDVLYGSLGADTILGNGGFDTIIYTNSYDSTVTSYDTIIDFTDGDKLQIGHSITLVSFKSATTQSTGNLSLDISNALAGQTQNFIQSCAALVTISGSQSDAGTYAVVANHTDATPGFVSATDTVVKLQNYQSGSLKASSFI